MKLYLDMDGVLADFDAHFAQLMNYEYPPRTWLNISDKEWDVIDATGAFWQHMPMLPDAKLLMAFCAKYYPTILTSLPRHDPPTGNSVANQKFWWAMNNLNRDTWERVQTVQAGMPKGAYAQPGDILVDDWLKHKQGWLDAGGIFIHHKSAADSIAQLKELGL